MKWFIVPKLLVQNQKFRKWIESYFKNIYSFEQKYKEQIDAF